MKAHSLTWTSFSGMRTMAAHGEDDVRRAQEDVAAAKESFDDAVEAAEARDADLPTGPDAPLTDPQRMLDEVGSSRGPAEGRAGTLRSGQGEGGGEHASATA